jgi:hypothetical protein
MESSTSGQSFWDKVWWWWWWYWEHLGEHAGNLGTCSQWVPPTCSQVLIVFPKMFPIPPLPPHFIIQVLQLSSWEAGLEFGLCCFLFWGYIHNTHNNYDNLLYDRYILTYLCGLFLYPHGVMGQRNRTRQFSDYE